MAEATDLLLSRYGALCPPHFYLEIEAFWNIAARLGFKNREDKILCKNWCLNQEFHPTLSDFTNEI